MLDNIDNTLLKCYNQVNLNTDKLVSLVYHPFTGGKFISNCLSIHSNYLPEESTLAIMKLSGKLNSKHMFNIIKAMFFLKKKFHIHTEFLDNWVGFGVSEHLRKDSNYDLKLNSSELEEPNTHTVCASCLRQKYTCKKSINCNHKTEVTLWSLLTNQEKYYYSLLYHPLGHDLEKDPFEKYVNHRTILITNYGWLLEKRKKEVEYLNYSKTFIDRFHNPFLFNIESSLYKEDFKLNMIRLLKFLNLEQDKMPWDLIDELRLLWLDSLEIGFPEWNNDSNPWFGSKWRSN